MNYHELIDVGTVSLTGFLLRGKRFFTRSLDSPQLSTAVEETVVTLETFETEGEQEIDVETPAGTYNAGYLPWQWVGDDAPTIVFHHGSGENPFDWSRFSSNSFRRLFATDAWDSPVNLVAVRAPFHDRSSMAYAQSMGNLADFVGMLAASTALVDALVGELHDRGSPLVLVSGISLGGYVANVHRTYRGTAERYAPMFAGASLGEMFVSSVYRTMTGDLAKNNPDRIREVLDFEDAFTERPPDNCWPLLGRYDRIIAFDVQRTGYRGMDLSVMEKGHITGSLATDALRSHIRSVLD